MNLFFFNFPLKSNFLFFLTWRYSILERGYWNRAICFKHHHHAATTLGSYQATCITVVCTRANRYVLAWATMTGNHTLFVDQEWVIQIWNGQSYDQKLKGLWETRSSSVTLSLKMLYEWRYTKSFVMRKAMHMICIFQFCMVFYELMPWKTYFFT